MKKGIFFTITVVLLIFAVSCGQRYKPAQEKEEGSSGKTYIVFEPIGEDDMDYDSNPAPPPPDIVVGTWKAPAKLNHVAYLEIYVDGIAGLYLGDANSDQLYEIYRGTVLSVSENTNEISLEMDFDLEWYIYESEDGSPIGVPDSYTGVYTLRHYTEGDKRMLHLTANDGADPLFGKKELKMELTPKTEGGSYMIDYQ